MPTAKKLPSGNWRVQAFVGTDKDGKKIRMSFTAPTKREAERQASVYMAQKSSSPLGMTVGDAIERYITAKTAVLSPSTILGYRRYQKLYYDEISRVKLHQLSTETMQLFVSSLVGKISPKTIANVYGLLYSSVTMFRPDAVFRVTLPKKKKQRPMSPEDEEVIKLFMEAGEELKIAIALAAFGSLRRGEICALKHSDVDGVYINVHADMVANENGEYEYKDFPKTSDSIRTVEMIPEIIALIPDGVDDEFIISANPDAITKRFCRLRDKHGMKIRFHDLRHYWASVGVAMGIPDTYLSDSGGWRRGSSVFSGTYKNSMRSQAEIFSSRMCEHFSQMITENQLS